MAKTLDAVKGDLIGVMIVLPIPGKSAHRHDILAIKLPVHVLEAYA